MLHQPAMHSIDQILERLATTQKEKLLVKIEQDFQTKATMCSKIRKQVSHLVVRLQILVIPEKEARHQSTILLLAILFQDLGIRDRPLRSQVTHLETMQEHQRTGLDLQTMLASQIQSSPLGTI
jgi:hypothetical protein